MTTAEYLQTPETALPRELAYGVLRVAESPFVPHQRAVLDFAVALDPFVRAGGLGEVLLSPSDIILDFDRALVVQPDLLFVSNERSEIVREHIYGAPDMVLEVLSPNPRIGRLEERVGWYAHYGVRECWVLRLPARELAVLALADGSVKRRRLFDRKTTIESAVLPGFDVSLASILRT